MSGTIVCTNCGAPGLVPDGGHAGLWDAGWRWVGTWGLFSCPGCPPVLEVDAEGRHKLGPGAAGGSCGPRAGLFLVDEGQGIPRQSGRPV